MNLNSVNQCLLKNNNLNYENVFEILKSLSRYNLNYADIYFQSSYHELWQLEEKIIKTGFYSIDQGLGIRTFYKDKIGFACSDKISLKELKKNAEIAFSINPLKRKINKKKNNILKNINYKSLYSNFDPLNSISNEEKIHLLHTMDKMARSQDSRIKKVNISLSGLYEHILIMSTDGTLAADIRPLVSLSLHVLVEDKGKKEQGMCGGGGRYGYQYFLEPIKKEIRAEKYVRKAVQTALLNLSSVAAPAGKMPVVLGPGFPGVLLHEAIGHGLEGDFNRRQTSAFTKKMGRKVASELCTIVDDSTLNGARGSLSIDDEGTPGKYNILIQDGILKNYMQDKMNAYLMKTISTGNGRRESYAHLPIPRMTNTYMLPGKSNPEEIVQTVKNGIYASNFNGGQVDITSGKFVFSTSEAYLIENGKITSPIKGATLIGSGKEIMQQISMVGNDLKLDYGIGVCSKEGQNIPVCVGQPTLKINAITVGGTK